MKIDLTSLGTKELTSFGEYLYNLIIVEKLKMKINSDHEYRGIEILLKEIGDEKNIIIVSVFKPSDTERYLCYVKAYEAEKTGKTSFGCKIIEYENKKYLCSVEGFLPEENDLIAICTLSKALKIKTIVFFEKEGISKALPTSYIGKILRRIA